MAAALRGPGNPTALDQALAALSFVARDPEHAHVLARQLLDEPAPQEARSVAWRAVGMAAHERGEDPLPALNRSLTIADTAGLDHRRAQAWGSRLSVLCQRTTAPPSFERPLQHQQPTQGGPLAEHAWLRRGVGLVHRGLFPDAAHAFTQALDQLGDETAPTYRAGLLNNRALSQLHRGHIDEAHADVAAAQALTQRHDLNYLNIVLQQNAASVAARDGNLAQALAAFDAAAPWLRGQRASALTLDRIEALLHSGEVTEARSTVQWTHPGDRAAEFAVLRLIEAHRALWRDDQHAALAQARGVLVGLDPRSRWREAARRIGWAARAGLRPRPAGCLPASRTGIARQLERYRTVWSQQRAAVAPALSGPTSEVAATPTELNQEWTRLGQRLLREHPPQPNTDRALPWPPAVPVEPVLHFWSEGERLGARLDTCTASVRHQLTSLQHVHEHTNALLQCARSQLGQANRALKRHLHELDRMLLAPVAHQLGPDGLVIIAEATLSGIPWGMLPSLRRRPVSVVPNLAAWQACRNHTTVRQGHIATQYTHHALLAAGPGLHGARAEVEALGQRYSSATVLQAATARTASVLNELDRCSVAHLAGHGIWDPNNPMCSGILLADGPLTTYDLMLRPRLPPLLVLAACETGSADPAGNARTAMSEAPLTAFGTTVLASTFPVDDLRLEAIMLRAHHALRAGVRPAAVVAHYLASSGFVCHGAG